MKKISSLFIALFLVTSLTTQAQNVGIGATTFTPNASAGLDVNFIDKGLLVPRVALTATNAVGPVTGAATSLLVYNTATAGVAPNNVTSGYYYWNGSAWVRFLSGNEAWKTTGNAGTTIATNFLGTTDDVAFAIRTNNSVRMRILGGTAAAGGQVVVNSTTAAASDAFSVYANSTKNQAINGYADSFSGGTGVYGVSDDNAGVYGEATSGVGVYGINSSTVNGGVQGFNTDGSGTGAIFAGNNLPGTFLVAGTGVSAISTNVGVYAVSTAANGMGVYGLANVASGTGVYGRSTNATGFAFWGQTTSGASTAAAFAGNGAATAYPATGCGVAGSGSIMGVYGASANFGDGAGGGYFTNGNASSFAYVGYRTGGINYKINGPGIVATIVRDLDNKRVNMFCPESPEILFQDFGKGELINGMAHIDLDPIFAKNIMVDAKHPLRVFVQLEGDCNGVYITNKTANSFDVKELQNGNSTVSFTWFVTANRADEIENGVVVSKNADMRFPDGPGPMESNIREETNEQKTGVVNTKPKTNK